MYKIHFRTSGRGSKDIELSIDGDQMVFDGTLDDLYIILAKILVIIEKDENIPTLRSLGRIDLYTDLLKRIPRSSKTVF